LSSSSITSNAATLILECGTVGLELPITFLANAALTIVGVGLVTHGGYVGYNTIQKFQSSSLFK